MAKTNLTKISLAVFAPAFSTPRVLVALILCAAAGSGLTGTLADTTGKPAFFRPEAPAKVRTLMYSERVAYQRAIENVYWRHRVWPKERPDPKPSLDAVMSQAQLEAKVEDYLRNSQALEDHWRRPITAEQLRAEMDRMAQHTKQPEVLRELFAALGNDPFIIAECLARPELSGRLLRNFYAHDERFHGELKRRVEADLGAHPTVRQMQQTSGKYSEIELVRSDSGESNRIDSGLKLTKREWDDNLQTLAAMLGSAPTTQIKTGILSPLQEDDERYYATAVLKKSEDRLTLATVEWRKESLESWRAKAENQKPRVTVAVAANYILPAISTVASGCADDTWMAMPGTPSARFSHTAVWTGSEMIVWGGWVNGQGTNTGGRYNPSTDSWMAISMNNAPDGRFLHTAVWSGTEMIVWGGIGNGTVNTGGRYNAETDSWTATSTINAPSARYGHTAVWTGREMIIWGGYSLLNTGGSYNPSNDRWTATSTTNAPEARRDHTAVWTGREMIIWGGHGQGGGLNSGGKYNPTTDRWIATTTGNAPSGRELHMTVWTGSEMIVWGGTGLFPLNSGGRYNPSSDSWTATSFVNAPEARYSHTAVWSGSEMIVWGGLGDEQYSLNTGGRYNPIADTWTATSTVSAPARRSGHTAVWSGSEMIVWGGLVSVGGLEFGGRYDPGTNSWVGVTNIPSARNWHTTVWTGSEMIVWSGLDEHFVYINTGGRYNPGLDSWTATSVTNAPAGRYQHTAVWSGSEMIVWGGGYDGPNFSPLNTGGRYNPGADSWIATSTTNVPAARGSHTAVWTGNTMVVWGGFGTRYLNTGGRYNPDTDSWIATSRTNAPSSREYHTAVWAESEMIIWGGFDGSSQVNTGGRYDPDTDSWIPTSVTDAPQERELHTAVWSGTEMIVWGGYNGGPSYFNTGGRYNPRTNSWTATSTANTPSGRLLSTAVWTNNEMIVWGGQDENFALPNTGGRYNPNTDSWTATTTTNAPDGRYAHTAVWTGSEMIVWGGYNGGASNTGGRYCAQAGPSITLSAAGRKVGGDKYGASHLERGDLSQHRRLPKWDSHCDDTEHGFFY